MPSHESEASAKPGRQGASPTPEGQDTATRPLPFTQLAPNETSSLKRATKTSPPPPRFPTGMYVRWKRNEGRQAPPDSPGVRAAWGARGAGLLPSRVLGGAERAERCPAPPCPAFLRAPPGGWWVRLWAGRGTAPVRPASVRSSLLPSRPSRAHLCAPASPSCPLSLPPASVWELTYSYLFGQVIFIHLCSKAAELPDGIYLELCASPAPSTSGQHQIPASSLQKTRSSTTRMRDILTHLTQRLLKGEHR
ncbi:uncharacterized protein LOC115598058 [Calypte anna]|uniref:uncharacterized protein LOC115598058 n=1 Tax=Calypte anna TaxID=9244 RepID=UPI0011C4A47D|nr:uncharacterized protein LOC115598058 [Calypte anna]